MKCLGGGTPILPLGNGVVPENPEVPMISHFYGKIILYFKMSVLILTSWKFDKYVLKIFSKLPFSKENHHTVEKFENSVDFVSFLHCH